MEQAHQHIRNLFKLRHMVHESEGFDREDEMIITKQIEQLKSAHEPDEDFTLEIKKYEEERVHQAIRHMEVQLANRIKVMEHAEKSLKIEESACPDMYAYFVKKQVLLLKKLNEIKKAFNISPSTSMGRTPGSIIRQDHPNTQLPLQKQRTVLHDAAHEEGANETAALPAENIETVPPEDAADPDVSADLLLEVLGETGDVKT